MNLNCQNRYAVGDTPTVRFSIVADSLHPTAQSTAITVQLMRPDGTIAATVSSPNGALERSTDTLLIGGEPFTVTYWDYTVPAFTVGSDRHPWRVKGTSTAGIIGVYETSAWVDRSRFPALA